MEKQLPLCDNNQHKSYLEKEKTHSPSILERFLMKVFKTQEPTAVVKHISSDNSLYNIDCASNSYGKLRQQVNRSSIFICFDLELSITEKEMLLNKFNNMETTFGKMKIHSFNLEYAFQVYDVLSIIIDGNVTLSETKTKITKHYLINTINGFESNMQTIIKNGDFCREMCKTMETNAIVFFEDKLKRKHENIRNNFVRKIETELKSLSYDYEHANEMLTNFKNEWNIKLETSMYMNKEDLMEFNNSVKIPMISSIKKIRNKSVNHFLKSYWTEIFDYCVEQNNKKWFEKEFYNIIVKPAEKLIISRVYEILKFGIFSKIEIIAIFKKILNRFSNELEDCIYSYRIPNVTQSYYSWVKKSIENKFYSNELHKMYRSYEQCLALLSKARKDALNKYITEMESKFNETVVVNVRIIDELHVKCEKVALEFHNMNTKEIKLLFNENVYQKINLNNIKSLVNDIKEDRSKYNDERHIYNATHDKRESIKLERNILTSEKWTHLKYFAIYYGLKEINGGYYKEGVILVNTNTTNSIAFVKNEIYYLLENNTEYKNLNLNLSPKNYCLQELLAEKMNRFSAVELRQYTMKFISDNISHANTTEGLISVESLIALQILKVKSETEEQLQQNISNLVFTIPQYFRLKETKFLDNVVKLVNLESITYLSEINALALRFFFNTNNLRPNETKLVLIAVLNQQHFDIVLCLVGNDGILQVAYYYLSLNEVKLSTLLTKIIAETETNPTIKNMFNISQNGKKHVDNIIIAGYSQYKENVVEILKNYFPKSICNDLNSYDLIYGAVIYSHIISNGINYKITEVAREATFIIFYNKETAPDSWCLLEKNQPFKDIKCYFNVPNNHFPIEIIIKQNEENVFHYKIPAEMIFKQCVHNFEVRVTINEKIEINYTIDNNIKRLIDDYKQDIDRKHEMLLHDKRMIESFAKKMKDENDTIKTSLLKGVLKSELKRLHDELLLLINSSTKISRVKKLSYMESLETALDVINSNKCKQEDYEQQILSLKTVFESKNI